ncbi:MAG: hypothetical protein AMJ75_02600 [Phycisphaerae bacterium SM1_79]|nr:MAG: hypothetical protein AMJ75_02600 [Phycisphaerae bacterium SM1_79]
MSRNLYFIPIIAGALQEPDIEKALKEAFCKIRRLGTEKRYAEGFSNFELFMASAYRHHRTTATDCALELIARLGTDTFEGGTKEERLLLDFIRSHPDLKTRYEAIRHMEEDEDLTQDFPVIGVLSDRGRDLTKAFSKVPGCESFERILPGNYTIRLVNTGWIIWEGELTAKKLIWSEAHKGRNLPLAAGEGQPTDEIDLLNNGEVILRTYAGIESGRIEIELTK